VLIWGSCSTLAFAFPVARERVLAFDERFGAHTIPIVILEIATGEEAMRGHAAHAFDAVEVVHEPAGSGAGIGLQREIVAQPGEAIFDRLHGWVDGRVRHSISNRCHSLPHRLRSPAATQCKPKSRLRRFMLPVPGAVMRSS